MVALLAPPLLMTERWEILITQHNPRKEHLQLMVEKKFVSSIKATDKL